MKGMSAKLAGRWYMLLICLVYTAMLLLNLPCIFKLYLGVPCPGCGMRRAIQAAASFQVQQAFREHPMFWSLPILAISIWKNGKLIANRMLNVVLHGVLVLGFLINYIYMLCKC